MTAQEAKQEATWNSLPRRIRKKIERTAKQGKYMVQFYPTDFLYSHFDVLSEHTITSINCLLEDLGYLVETYRDTRTGMTKEVKVTWL